MRTIRWNLVGRAAGLAISAVLGAAVLSAGAAVGAPADSITRKTRERIAFSLAKASQPAGDVSYAIGRIAKNGRPIRPPRNMRLDAKTGEFSWLPTESQAGAYEVTFLVRRLAAGAPVEVPRRITVEAGEITADRGEVGRLLKAWYRAGTAAGNTGDFYDNRDRGHSRLNTKLFGQLDRVEYTEAMKQRRLDWGVQLRVLFPHVTFGNSSTASGDMSAGSNTRLCLRSPRSVSILYRQYRRSHLYVYPEHRDHDVGHNGLGGFGDLFPANTPYVITSQGSSGSDRAFLEAIAFTLAAFRPEVKKRLIATGLLMPTVQMIFRMCNRNVARPKDYLTGKAHPTVFERGNIDKVRMVQMAHAIRIAAVPPMVRLAVVEEDHPVAGRDYFEAARGEKLFDTPGAVARIWRSVKGSRRMVVSAAGSRDINGLPLTYHWVVLRGRADRIRIRPVSKDGSVVELLVDYHERMPIRPGSAMESNRVDIGAFVHNGKYYSAPGFVCFYSLDNESRTYDAAGRIVEVDYARGDTTIGWPTARVSARDKKYDITDWPALLELIVGGKDGSFPVELLRTRLSGPAMGVLRRAAGELRAAAKDARTDAHRILTAPQRRMAGSESVKQRLEKVLNEIKDDPSFYIDNAGRIAEACRNASGRESFGHARDALVRDGVLAVGKDGSYRLSPMMGGDGPAVQRLTKYERSRLERFNLTILQDVLFPGLLNLRFRPNYVSPHLSTPKDWRDVYHYDSGGRLIGWTRHGAGGAKEFTRDGAVVLKTDKLGRALEARVVLYAVERDAKGGAQALRQVPGATLLRYEYDSDTDRVGRSLQAKPGPRPS